MTVKYLITKTFTITLIFSSVNVAISFYFFSLEYFLVLSLSFYGSLCVPIFILMLNFKILLWIQWAWPWLKFLWQRVQDISLSISFALMFNICSKWNKCLVFCDTNPILLALLLSDLKGHSDCLNAKSRQNFALHLLFMESFKVPTHLKFMDKVPKLTPHN